MKLNDIPLIDSQAIQTRVAELGREISVRYTGQDLLMLTVLKGAVLFGSDLMRHITVPLRIDFIGARSYSGTCSTGEIAFTYLPQEDLAGRHILLVEDILDTGLTATAILRQLQTHSPASLTLCTLLDKPSRRKVTIEADYVGFTIDDHFVVGYGLDYEQRHRELPDIRILTP